MLTGHAAAAVTGGRAHPAPREEEPEGVAGDSGEEHPDVERHDGQHHQVRHPHPGRVHRGQQRRGRRRRWRRRPPSEEAAAPRRARRRESTESPSVSAASASTKRRQRAYIPAPRSPGQPRNRTTARSLQKKVMCIIIAILCCGGGGAAAVAWPERGGAIAIGPIPSSPIPLISAAGVCVRARAQGGVARGAAK